MPAYTMGIYIFNIGIIRIQYLNRILRLSGLPILWDIDMCISVCTLKALIKLNNRVAFMGHIDIFNNRKSAIRLFYDDFIFAFGFENDI